ncbi:MAG TPA: NAD-dependent epimerase/dehydratase family protein [Thermoanaerobaculia bacterium]|nr:NAD-dependent epimerase/dehydratase family protein [Thermoanaerobaculia bacterium]
MKGLSVLVTGGAGFIGSHLVDALLAGGAQVRVLDDFSSGRRDNLPADVKVIEGDIRDMPVCRRACAGMAVVFHQAALGSVPRSLADPATTMAVNVTGTANVLAAAREAGVRRVVYASSSSVYGDAQPVVKKEGEEGRPLSPYAASKVMNEELAEVFARCYGMELIGLRYFNVYGPRQAPEGPYAAVIPRFFRACLAGEAPVIYGAGEQSRDFTFVDDAVRANLLAAAAPAEACGRSYNVARGERTTIAELASRVREVAGSGLPPRHEPPRPGDVLHSQADPSAAERRLGFRAEVGLSTGLARARTHYRAEEPSWRS